MLYIYSSIFKDRSSINLNSTDSGAQKRFLSKSLVDNTKYVTPNTNRFSNSKAEDDKEPLLAEVDEYISQLYVCILFSHK